MKRRPVVYLFCLLAFLAAHAAAQTPISYGVLTPARTPLPNGVQNPVWSEAFRYLIDNNDAGAFHQNIQPYDVEEARAVLRRIRRRSPSRLDRRLAQRLLDDLPAGAGVSIGAQAGVSLYGSLPLPYLNGAVRLLHPKGTELTLEARAFPADARIEPLPGESSARFRTRPWNPFNALPDEGEYVADFTRAALAVPFSGVRAALGRMPLRWGPGQRAALLLSDDSPSLDGLFIDGAYGQFKGAAVFAALNPIWIGDGAERYLAKRFFSARRLNWKASPALEIGLSDAIVYGGDLRGPEIRYLNPLLPFYASQFNAANDVSSAALDDNVMAALDVQWRPARRHTLYAELLIDDLRYDPHSNDPHALAWLVGWRKNGGWTLEYSRVQRFAYTHLKQENRYTHYGRSLGHFLGNDADLLHASYALFQSPDVRWSFSFEQQRKGNSGVDDRYRGESDISFLKGGGEKTRSTRVGVWARRDRWLFRSALTIHFIEDRSAPTAVWNASIERPVW